MFEAGIYEAKANLSKIIRRVQKGEECVITVRGKPVARLNAIAMDGKDVATSLKEIRAYSKKRPVNAKLDEILAWRHEGHQW